MKRIYLCRRRLHHIPNDSMCICDNGGHAKSSLGKFPHISRRACAISSSVIRTLKSAQSPLILRRFPLEGLLVLRNSTKSRTSCCFSGGKSRKLLRIVCSMVINFPISTISSNSTNAIVQSALIKRDRISQKAEL